MTRCRLLAKYLCRIHRLFYTLHNCMFSGKRERNGKNMKNFKDFLREEDGMGTVEIILIIVVLVGLVIIFKSQITDLVESIFDKISTQTSKV